MILIHTHTHTHTLTKVADLEVAVPVEQQVRGLQISMDHSRRVHVLEPAKDLIYKVLWWVSMCV
jgi:hypothetical protein